ncbi:MAG: hypothetical protein ACFFG0_05640 [Candidatus Thorarchaeota archaeon]
MTTPYCSKDQWAVRKSSKNKSYSDWDDYTAENNYPDANSLDEALEDGATTINKIIGWATSNITSSTYTSFLEFLNYKLANRRLMVEQYQGYQAGKMMFSPQDLLFEYEREDLKDIGRLTSKRKVGKWVF